MSKENVLITIDGDDSQYEKTLKGLEKKAKDTAAKAQKAIEEANAAVKKAMDETGDKAKAAADKTVKETQRAAKEAIAEAKKASEEVARYQSKSMQNSADIVSGVNKGVKTLAVAGAAAATAVVGIGTGYNMQMEQYNAGFTTMLGNAERAGELMEDLKGFAEVTPFELTDLADASTTLLSFGEEVEELMPDLKMLGDISLGNKEKFKSLALVFGQVQSQGRLMGQDLLQMINAGFNPLQIISEKTGKSMTELKDEMADGAISYEMVADAMRTATSEGGKFYNAMETQSKTAQGQLSTLKDNVTAFFGEMSQGFSEVLSEDVLPAAIEGVEWLNEKLDDGSIEEFFKKAAMGAAGFGAALGTMNIILVANDLVQLKKGIEGYEAATKLGTAAQKLFNAELLKSPYTWAGMALAAVVAGVATYAVTHIGANDEIVESNKKLHKSIEDLSESRKQAYEAIDEKANAEKAEAERAVFLKNKLYDLEQQIRSGTLSDEEAVEVKKDFENVAAQLEEIIPGITGALYDETGELNVQKTAVDNLVNSYYDLAVAKAMASAYQDKFEQDAKDLITAKENLKTAQENAEKVDELTKKTAKKDVNSLNGLMSKVDALARNTANKVSAPLTIAQAQSQVDEITARQEEHFASMNEYKDSVKTLTEKYLKAGGKIDDQETSTNYNFGSSSTTGKSSGGGGSSSTNKAAKEAEKAAREAEKAQQEAYRKELRNLKHQKELCQITELEYYQSLVKIRDSYFTEGDEEWQQHTEEIAKYLKESKEDIVEEWTEAFEEIEEERKSFADNLKSDNKAFRTLTFHGGDTSESYTRLADVGADNAVLEQYSKMLDELSVKAGGIPDLVAEQLQGLSPEDAVKYLKAVLDASDAEFEKYISDINKNSELAESIGDKLYVDEFEDLAQNFSKSMTDEFDDIKKAFTDEFGELPEDFFSIGENSGEEFTSGFLGQYKMLMDSIQSEVNAMLSTKVIAAETFAQRAEKASVINHNNNYTDNRSTTINAPEASTRGIIEAEKQRDVWLNHTTRLGATIWKR